MTFTVELRFINQVQRKGFSRNIPALSKTERKQKNKTKRLYSVNYDLIYNPFSSVIKSTVMKH